MNTFELAHTTVPALGIGTWYLGEGDQAHTEQEIAALRYGLDHGLTVIDTAEMYGEGKAESLVGQAISGYARDSLYLISKFYPWHATARQMRHALENSLARLGVDYLDLYLYHWRGETPLAETIAGMQALQQAGLIKAYGVSNFDVADLQEAATVPGGENIAVNEVCYNLAARGIEYDLMPYQAEHHQSLIGYSPFNSGAGDTIRLPQSVQALAREKNVSSHQLMLAWAGRNGNVLPIPKAGSISHMQQNLAAMAITFTPKELAVIDAAFSAPTRKQPLTMI